MTTLDEGIAAYAKAMEAFDHQVGIPQEKPDYEILEKLLNLRNDQLEEMSGRQAAEHGYILGQFAFWLQRRENLCRTYVRWAEQNRRACDAQGRERLQRLVDQAELKAQRIAFLGRRVEFMATCLHNVARSRPREEGKS